MATAVLHHLTHAGLFELPATDSRLACRLDQDTFMIEGISTPEGAAAVKRAKAACRQCPVAEACLKWALANPESTRIGVWAATTPTERRALRKGLVERLGEDWPQIVAAQDAARAARARQHRSPTASPRQRGAAA
jgi:transcription factor WhiB